MKPIRFLHGAGRVRSEAAAREPGAAGRRLVRLSAPDAETVRVEADVDGAADSTADTTREPLTAGPATAAAAGAP